jgi:hypothetical protein
MLWTTAFQLGFALGAGYFLNSVSFPLRLTGPSSPCRSHPTALPSEPDTLPWPLGPFLTTAAPPPYEGFWAFASSAADCRPGGLPVRPDP